MRFGSTPAVAACATTRASGSSFVLAHAVVARRRGPRDAPSLMRRAVARRHRAALAEHRLELRERLERRVAARATRPSRRRPARRRLLLRDGDRARSRDRTRPRPTAAAAFFCDASANASCSSRAIAHFSATFSAVSPIDWSGKRAAIRGFSKRQPMRRVVDRAAACARRPRRSCRTRTARASCSRRRRRSTTSASPVAIRLAASHDGLEPRAAEAVHGDRRDLVRERRRGAPPCARRCGCPRRPGWWRRRRPDRAARRAPGCAGRARR